MASDQAQIQHIQRIRKDIHQALEDSLNSFANEANLENVSERHNTLLVGKLESALLAGKRALNDLSVFWKTPALFSESILPAYVWISILSVDAQGQLLSSELEGTMQSLEKLWLYTERLKLVQRESQNMICICSIAEDISPPSTRMKGTMKQFGPSRTLSSRSVCESAFVAALFLLRPSLHFDIEDMVLLVDAGIWSNSSEDVRLLPNIEASTLALDKNLPIEQSLLWYSNPSKAVIPVRISRASTKVLLFPSALPSPDITPMYMKIYQPHSMAPSSKSRCAVWGTRVSDTNSWASLVVLQNPQMAVIYDENIRRLITISAEYSTQLSSHWIHLMQPIYKLGLSDARLTARDALRRIEKIRYQNTAKPTAEWANTCLLYLNHFECFKLRTARMQEEVEHIPSNWNLSSPPVWAQKVSDECQLLENELALIYNEIRSVRSMILEQLNLKQSARATLLTILASLFLPTSLVASFFGMNTREINGSTWSLKYFFIAAIPFSIITIVLPMIVLPVFYFLARHWNASPTLMNWTVILVFFIYNIIVDILSFFSIKNFIVEMFLYMSMVFWGSTWLYWLYLQVSLRYQEEGRGEGWKLLLEKAWWIVFCFFAYGTFLVRVFGRYLFVEISPFLVYFAYAGIRYWRRSKEEKQHSTTERRKMVAHLPVLSRY